MQSEAWAIQIGRLTCHLKASENGANAIDELGRQASPILVYVEPPEAFVTKALDHAQVVKCQFPFVKGIAN
jgi:hypothetical protein